jgi:hypothetical protein
MDRSNVPRRRTQACMPLLYSTRHVEPIASVSLAETVLPNETANYTEHDTPIVALRWKHQELLPSSLAADQVDQQK